MTLLNQRTGTNRTIDPICGMTVVPVFALCAEREGLTFNFCGDNLQQKFLSMSATAKHEEKSIISLSSEN